MKKWRVGIVGAILVAALVSTTALAAGYGHGWYANTAASIPAGTCAWMG